jgi:hypothetical protein
MTNPKCEVCGAEILPATSFCRQCGSVIAPSGALDPAEQPTAIFGNESATTQRLDSRPTRPNHGLQPSAQGMAIGSNKARGRNIAVGALVLIVIVVGILVVVTLMRKATPDAVADASALKYPGAATVVDLTDADGGHAIQLRSKDPLAQVENWYQTNHKLSKTVRLTSNSVVMKNEKTTITLVEEDKATAILIKASP